MWNWWKRASFLGGDAIQFCCKAADECQKCGACSVEKRLLEVIEEPRIKISLGSEIKEVSRNKGFSYTLSRRPLYAMRMAQAITHRHPEIKTTIFYMDIQNCGKNFSEFYERCKDNTYRESRERGVFYFTLRELPDIRQDGSNLQVGFHDSVLNRHVKLIPDMVVVEEAFRPHPDAARVSRVLRIDTDSEGFFQQDNVHYLPIRTNREGIFVIGSAMQPRNLMHGWTDKELGPNRIKKQAAA